MMKMNDIDIKTKEDAKKYAEEIMKSTSISMTHAPGLRTLKDMDWIKLRKLCNYEAWLEWNGENPENIPDDWRELPYPEVVRKSDLRANAIIRVKMFKTVLQQHIQPLPRNGVLSDECKFIIRGRIEEIMEFYNLSEEDLK